MPVIAEKSSIVFRGILEENLPTLIRPIAMAPPKIAVPKAHSLGSSEW